MPIMGFGGQNPQIWGGGRSGGHGVFMKYY